MPASLLPLLKASVPGCGEKTHERVDVRHPTHYLGQRCVKKALFKKLPSYANQHLEEERYGDGKQQGNTNGDDRKSKSRGLVENNKVR
jgi:hypothetical protein